MKGIKVELLGIATILLGIAVTTNNFFGYVLGFLGFGAAYAAIPCGLAVRKQHEMLFAASKVYKLHQYLSAKW